VQHDKVQDRVLHKERAGEKTKRENRSCKRQYKEGKTKKKSSTHQGNPYCEQSEGITGITISLTKRGVKRSGKLGMGECNR